MHRKGFLEVKGESCYGTSYPDTFLLGSILAKRYLCIHGSSLRYTKYGLCTRQIKMTDQRKPRKNAPYNWFKLLCWATQTHPLSLPVCLSTCIVLFLLLVNTLLTSLLSVFVEILFWKVKGSGLLSLTSDLVARIWCCDHCEPQSLPVNPSPGPSYCGWGHLRSICLTGKE